MTRPGLRRRSLLQGSAGLLATSGLAAPHVARAAGSNVLKFVPQANLANLDPIWGTQYVVRNASLLIWDTLFGVDANLTPKPQMVESYDDGGDGKTWTFKLRTGLKFHDGTPVLSRDVVASLQRWIVRDTMGAQLRPKIIAMEAVDDRTTRIRLNAPFPKMLFALGKNNAPVAFIMPERIAKTDPFQQIPEYVGSGPMKFLKDEWVPGGHATFGKFDGYVPRDEPVSWMSGGKRITFDRIEWIIMPQPETASAALQRGEVDWWELPLPDLIPLLKKNKDIRVDIADPLGNIGSFRMNHLFPPFDNQKIRQAVQMALSQQDYMEAVVGGDPELWKPCPSYFTPGTALYTEAGGDRLKGKRDYAAAKKLLAEAGYNGEKVVLLVATDVAITKAEGDMTADTLKKMGMNVDYQSLDWGTVGTRRASRNPPDKGGWNIFHTWHAGADCVNPAPYTALDTGGASAWFGWPNSPEIEKLIGDWYTVADPAAEKQVIADINAKSMDFVTYVPTGFFLAYQAWRSNISGIVRAPFPAFWDVKKA